MISPSWNEEVIVHSNLTNSTYFCYATSGHICETHGSSTKYFILYYIYKVSGILVIHTLLLKRFLAYREKT